MRNINIAGILVVIGAPGSGKTVVAKALSERLGCKYLNAGDLALEKGYVLERDLERDSYVIDDDKVKEEISRIIEATPCLVLETISPYSVPEERVSLVVVVRCRPSLLLKRLKERGYNSRKIRENIEYEAVDGPLFDAMEIASEERVVEVDGCEGSLEDELNYILSGKRYRRFNWTQDFLSILEEISK
ncbi:MAG: AAA family ATPase [Candidatus Korarchaeum sp.]|nr:AAA family ATPase [Candidatus Korarchaeum sp.]MDW8035613.1 AAA family ATPase [Candidatus Korarchaeum sp.]